MANDLLSEIREFLARTGMGPSYFGKASCGNSELVERLERGRTVTLVTAERVRAFMQARAKKRATLLSKKNRAARSAKETAA